MGSEILRLWRVRLEVICRVAAGEVDFSAGGVDVHCGQGNEERACWGDVMDFVGFAG